MPPKCQLDCREMHDIQHVARVLNCGLRQAYRRTQDIRSLNGRVRCDRLRELVEEVRPVRKCRNVSESDRNRHNVRV